MDRQKTRSSHRHRRAAPPFSPKESEIPEEMTNNAETAVPRDFGDNSVSPGLLRPGPNVDSYSQLGADTATVPNPGTSPHYSAHGDSGDTAIHRSPLRCRRAADTGTDRHLNANSTPDPQRRDANKCPVAPESARH